MKRIIAVLLSILVSLGITMGAGFALAEGEPDGEHEAGKYEVTFSSNPLFPIAGEEAELTLTIYHDGIPVEGLVCTLLLTRTEVGHDDDHGEAEADAHQEGDEHTEAEHTEADAHQEGDEHTEGEDGAIELIALETSPGVYVASYTFVEGGKYLGTALIGEEHHDGDVHSEAEEHIDFTVAVRSAPIDWPLIATFAAIPLFAAGIVAIIKSARKDW